MKKQADTQPNICVYCAVNSGSVALTVLTEHFQCIVSVLAESHYTQNTYLRYFPGRHSLRFELLFGLMFLFLQLSVVCLHL